MKEKFVIDTNVIMLDPYCINKLGGTVYITTTVLEELDKHKTDNGEKGRNIREFARIIDKSELKNIEFVDTHKYFDIEVNDDKIIAAAEEEKAILVTNDILMSIKARAVGIKTQRYEPVNIVCDSAYSGFLDSREDVEHNKEVVLNPNQFHLAKNGLFTQKGNKQKRLSKDKEVWGISHRNVEQKCALHALLDDDIKLVTIAGKAGTGKTLLAIAAGLQKVVEENKYRRLLVSRPVIPMGNDIGYLPGDINEKLGPWMQPIFDNIDFLFNIEGSNKEQSYDAYKELEGSGILKVEALTYIRGRSIPEHYIIIDEAQNLTKHEVKTIISRAGDDTKIILTGDPDQIDNPKLDSINNGLTYVIEKFKDQPIAAHITLSKCERSELADVAAEIL